MNPWEKYQGGSESTQDGPWSKYSKEPDGLLMRGAKAVVGSNALPIAGGAIGAMAGGPAGAALGGAAGEAFKQLGSRAVGLDAPKTAGEAAKNIGIEGAVQGVTELVAAPILGAAGKAVKAIPGVKPALEGAGNLAKKTAGDIFQIATKMKPKNASTIFANPEGMLPGAMNKASQAWRTAAAKIGLPVDLTAPEIINALKNKDYENMVYDTFSKIESKQPVSAAEAQIAKETLDAKMMPAVVNERNRKMINYLNQIRESFMNRIASESQDMAAANKEYAVAKAGEKFKSLVPMNKDMTPAYFRSTMTPAMLAGIGLNRDHPVLGGAAGIAAGAMLSPLAFGTAIAGSGAIAPAVKAAIPYAKQLVQTALANALANKMKSKESK